MEEETKTIRVGLSLWRELNSMRGYNNCKTFEDVLKWNLNKIKELNNNEDDNETN